MTDNTKRLRIRVRGRVQGVWYRASAAEEARRLGVNGWVRNCSDGSVEALAEGPAAAIDTFVAWCREGPPHARVQDVRTIEEAPDSPLTDFEVRH